MPYAVSALRRAHKTGPCLSVVTIYDGMTSTLRRTIHAMI